MRNAVVVSAVRTGVARAKKGSFINTRVDDLGAIVVKEAVNRVKGLDPAEIEDVIMGCAIPEAEQGMNVGRIISLLAGFPLSVAGATVNRFCASGLQAINMAAQAIMTGCGDVHVAGGVEHMTHVPMGGFNKSPNPKLLSGDFPPAYIPMGMTSAAPRRTSSPRGATRRPPRRTARDSSRGRSSRSRWRSRARRK
jgi:acetyl-CoA acyltransferase